MDSESVDKTKAQRLENSFYALQARQRSALRIASGRGRAVDRLVFYANCVDSAYDFEGLSPSASLEDNPTSSDKAGSANGADGGSLSDLDPRASKDLVISILQEASDADMAVISREIDFNTAYLEDLMTATRQELVDLGFDERGCDLGLMKDKLVFWKSIRAVLESASSMHGNADIQSEIDSLLGGKTVEELNSLHDNVQAKLNGREVVDVEYWELLDKSIAYHTASRRSDAIIKKHFELFQEVMKTMNEKLLKETSQADDESPDTAGNDGSGRRFQDDDDVFESMDACAGFDRSRSPQPVDSLRHTKLLNVKIWDEEVYSDRLAAHRFLVLTNNYSPHPEYRLDDSDQLMDIHFTDKRGRKRTDNRKVAMINSINQVSDVSEVAESHRHAAHFKEERITGAFLRMQQQELDSDEEVMEDSAMVNSKVGTSAVSNSVVTTADGKISFRPRKPRYYNLVFTGFEWNRYNATHYDKDNPPPKSVQGYRFNIFYPNLIDRSRTPKYRLIKDTQSEDDTTCLIVFEGGPPYEDIAFRIINKEWEFGHRRGFVSSFNKGVMHLWFKFKRLNR